jgi:hypothetical protein
MKHLRHVYPADHDRAGQHDYIAFESSPEPKAIPWTWIWSVLAFVAGFVAGWVTK